jgi:hypothetical protein
VAGGCDLHIYVFDYNTMKKVHCFEALTEQITSLAIHPRETYVLAASYASKLGCGTGKMAGCAFMNLKMRTLVLSRK